MSDFGRKFYGISSNFTKFGKGFLNPSLYLPRCGGQDVWRYFQPQSGQTQEASGNPRAACHAGRDAGGALDAGARPLARRHPRQADRAGFGRIRQYHPPQRRDPARGDLLRRDDAEIGRLYPRLQRHRAQLRNPARQPARQPALDPQHHAREQGRRGAVLDAEHSGRPQHRRPRLFQEGAGNPRFRFQRLSVRQDQQPADHDGGLSGLRDQSGRGFGVGRRHQSRLAVEDHGQPRRTAGHFSAADRQHRRRDGGAARPGQHDRPAARQCAAAVGHRLQGAQLQLPIRARFRLPRPTAPGAPSVLRAFPARNRA